MHKKGVLATAGVIILAAALLYHSRSDPPIELVDGSVGLTYVSNFDVVNSKEIKADKHLYKVQSVEVLNRRADGTYEPVETIDVKNRDWTMTSADATLRIRRVHHLTNDEVPIEALGQLDIARVIPGDDSQFFYNSTSHFTPATLTFTSAHPVCLNGAGPNACTLSCPSGYCRIRLTYK